MVKWTEKIVPTLMLAGVASLVLSLLLGGFIMYQWVLACEATLTSLVLLVFYLRYHRHDSRKSKWPPLLPLAVIGAAGGAKSFYVATGRDTPLLVVIVLLAAVVWFFILSWKIWRAERNVVR
ncbi:MAG TPA: hypothetical protein VJT09_06205 [Pyrinomonadaceae bacterium]|nr:hypothetical protein [Pyrinomonadaceae bacterium]